MSIQIDGREYGLVSLEGVHGDIDRDFPPYALKPVKQEPQYTVELYKSGLEGWERCIDITLNVSEDQAQLIKQSVEVLMQYITDSDEYGGDLISVAGEARHLIMRGVETKSTRHKL